MENNKLQVWWVPQVPMKAFTVDVDTVTEAVKMMNVLANYDLFQFENRVKPDYANTGGLNQFCEEEKDYLDWSIDFNVTINGVDYVEYFDDPREFVEFLYQNNLTEKQVYEAMEK